MNKKAEGSISALIITMIVAFSALALISSLIINMTGSEGYAVESAPEFQQYEAMQQDFEKNYTDEFARSQDNLDELDQKSSWLNKVYTNIENAWQDSIFGKAWNTIKLMPKLIGFSVDSITLSLNQGKLNLPKIFITLLITLATITIVILMVRVIWTRKI